MQSPVKYVRLAACLLFAAGLASCETPAPVSQVVYSLNATAQLNPDSSGRPSPVVLRLYELRSSGSFESAEFFALYSNEAKTLGQSLISRKEMQIGPGEKREFIEKLQPGTRVIGVVAAFRNLSSNQWRALIPVQDGKSVSVQLNLLRTSISVDASGN